MLGAGADPRGLEELRNGNAKLLYFVCTQWIGGRITPLNVIVAMFSSTANQLETDMI